jgi:hypothetical protein
MSEPVDFSSSLITEPRDYPEWHRGRDEYGVWLLPVRCPALLAYIRQAQAELADLLLPCAGRQPHLTLYVCGFSAPQQRLDDDYSEAMLAEHHQQLSALQPAPTRLALPGLDSFSSAAYIAVEDSEGELAHWRRALAASHEEIRFAPYRAHITLGLYRRSLPRAELMARLQALPPLPVSHLTVDRILYATYQARQLQGPLQVRRCIRLGEGPEARVFHAQDQGSTWNLL